MSKGRVHRNMTDEVRFETGAETKARAGAMFKVKLCKNDRCKVTSKNSRFSNGFCHECSGNPLTVNRVLKEAEKTKVDDANRDKIQGSTFGWFA
jgi:hypothetical protein